jgi:hypothetical protein
MLLPAGAVVRLDDFLDHIQVAETRVLENECSFERIVEVLIEQPVDHRHPDGPTFSQRLYISHVDPSKPVVFVTAGYDASYYFTSEIAARLSCNQIIAEHRYFGRSKPDSLDWQYLDTWQAASDHHRIVQLFKELYPSSWISTGISKGGQSAIYHSYYYPEDVDVRIPYVAPLNYAVEDDRIYSFLDNVGSRSARRKVERFQKTALKYEERYLPAFEEFSKRRGYTYEIAGGMEQAYEYCVLEYSFAFWQWANVPARRIPGRSAAPGEFVAHMNRVAGFDYFDDSFISEHLPFFYQVLTEMGYYGYDLDRFDGYINYVDDRDFSFVLPPEIRVDFNPDLSREVAHYLKEEADRFIFIYGEQDTWSAAAVNDLPGDRCRVFIKEGGSHRTRINNMPEAQKEEVYRTLREFLDAGPGTDI